MRSELKQLVEWWRESEHVVFFGGAGVSTESGVPDFRSETGIYAQYANAEEMLTPDFMNRHPDEFYDFYRKYFLVTGIKPNAAHRGLARLEAKGKLGCIITQNIDGLHQMAGSNNVIELHGNSNRYVCTRCNRAYDVDYVRSSSQVPRCKAESRFSDGVCNGMLRPAIVLYEETLNFKSMQDAGRAIAEADLLVIGGSSLQVWPAASLIDYLEEAKLVVINRNQTMRDQSADLLIREPIGEVFTEITEKILED